MHMCINIWHDLLYLTRNICIVVTSSTSIVYLLVCMLIVCVSTLHVTLSGWWVRRSRELAVETTRH